jgi:plastocyanin
MRVADRSADLAQAWRRVLRRAAIVNAVILAIAAVALTDAEAAAIAVAFVIGLLLLRVRGGWLGVIALGLLFADVAAWMLPGAISNITHGDGFAATALPAALSAVSLGGLVATIGSLVRRRAAAGPGEARFVAGATVFMLVAALVGGAVSQMGTEEEAAPSGGLAIDMKDVKFLPDELEAQAGSISVSVKNSDLFWHTFTIRELNANVSVPVQAERELTFEAQPGTYEFICAIPGHTQAGMKGTLTVR